MQCAMEIADRIFMLGDGKIIDEGDVDHMKHSEVALVREFLKDVQGEME